jgi:hypothetical protein
MDQRQNDAEEHTLEKGWWDFSGDQLLKAAAKDLLGFDIEHSFGAKP